MSVTVSTRAGGTSDVGKVQEFFFSQAVDAKSCHIILIFTASILIGKVCGLIDCLISSTWNF